MKKNYELRIQCEVCGCWGFYRKDGIFLEFPKKYTYQNEKDGKRYLNEDGIKYMMEVLR